MTMDLHRVGKEPEWKGVSQPNAFQVVAEATDGLVTPGNVVSGLGLGLVLDGLRRIRDGRTVLGLSEVTAGRLCDLADGAIAHKTGTKSPLGEALDATFDKIGTAATLPTFMMEGIVPPVAGLAIGAQNVANAALSMEAVRRGNRLHPSQSGKVSVAMQWATMGAYGLSEILSSPSTKRRTRLLGHALAAGSTVLGIAATVGYAKDLLNDTAEPEETST